MTSYIIFCKTLLKGGAEKQAIVLSKLIKSRGFSCTLISWSGNQIDMDNLNYINQNSIDYIGLQGNPLSKFIHFLKIIKSREHAIVLSYLSLPNFIAGISRIFSHRHKTIGGIRTEQLPGYKFLFEKFIHNHLNTATVFNNYSARDKFIKRGFISQKIYVIHNAIHASPAFDNNKTNDTVNIISVSRFVESKDFRTALSSLRILKENCSDRKFIFYIVGYGPLENEIRLLINEFDLENEVNIIIKPPDIYSLLRNCHIYLSTSLYEGLSNSIMEAMVAELPIIATNVGDNQYLVKESFNGFVVPCGDIKLIASKLEYLVISEKVRNEFGKNSYKIIRDEFSEEIFLEKYFKLFSRMESTFNSGITPSN